VKESGRSAPLNIVPSIESARGLWNLGAIAGWKASGGNDIGVRLSAVLVWHNSTAILCNVLTFSSLQQRTVSFDLVEVHLLSFPYLRSKDCADTSILRSASRRELLFTRSQIVIAAKTFGLEAIDMVCLISPRSILLS
jgi:citrate lyase beta subunit